MYLLVTYSLIFLLLHWFSKVTKIDFSQVFLIVNFNASLSLILGGTLSLSILGSSFLNPITNWLIFAIILTPILILIIIHGIFGKLYFSKRFIRNNLDYLIPLLKKSFSKAKNIFFILYIINLIIMIINNIFFREYYRYIISSNLNSIYTLTYISGIFTTWHYMFQRKYIKILIVLFLIFTLGKKHPILLSLMIPLIFSFYKSNSIKLKTILIGAIGFYLFAEIAKYYTKGIEISTLEQLSSSLDYYYNFNYFLSKYPLGIDNGNIYLSSFYKFIPRYFWGNKPEVYGFLHIHDKLFYKEMIYNFYPSVFEEYATPLADFGIILGAIWIIISKVLIYILLMFKKTPLVLKVFLCLYLIDPVSGIFGYVITKFHEK